MGVAAVDLWSNFPILGPYSLAVTGLTTVSSAVLAADKNRKGVIFANPGTQNKRVMPAGSTLVGGAGGGGILLYPQTEWSLMQTENSQFNVNCPWVGVTDDASDGALTVFDFTPNTPNAPEVPPTTRLFQQNDISSPVGSQTTNLGTGSALVLAADPNRTGVVFMNPGTVAVAVCPSNLSAAFGAGSLIILPGGTKEIVGNDRVRVNCAWNGIAESGSTNEFTALSLYG